MITISDAELHKAFQREYPNDLTRTTEGELLEFDDDRAEVEKLVGKNWEGVRAEILQECFDIASWLNPKAFHYFFPAFIKQSQVDMKKTSLLVDSLIDMLADKGVHWPESMKDAEAKLSAKYPEVAEGLASIDEKKLSVWRQERWKLFTKQQWDLIRRWLNWIDQDEKWEVDRDVLRKAIKNAENWQTTSLNTIRLTSDGAT
jgi:hypothetical protein